MNYSKDVWNQLKGITKDELITALEKDNYELDATRGAVRAYRNKETGNRITIHYHPNATFKNPGLLKAILDDLGWTEKDMKRLKLIK